MHADYEQFVPKLESLIHQHGSLRCYCEIGNYQGVSLRAIWDELKFDVTHCNQIERCAVVGDSTRQKWTYSKNCRDGKNGAGRRCPLQHSRLTRERVAISFSTSIFTGQAFQPDNACQCGQSRCKQSR
ncbi:MAG: STAS/SEC14 domain-containing protein [Patescibacteria group bacterium]|nr:STAS/SEC14 domain-containing protein [Patescibacteria group bacterium]